MRAWIMAGLVFVAAGCGSNANQSPTTTLATTGTVDPIDARATADAWILYFKPSTTSTQQACLRQVYMGLTAAEFALIKSRSGDGPKEFYDSFNAKVDACYGGSWVTGG